MVLKNAGVVFRIDHTEIDEKKLRAALAAKNMSPASIGHALATEKAKTVSLRPKNKDGLVIGADQMLVCEGRMFEKPEDLNAALRQLKALRGKTHTLLASAVIYRNGKRLFTIEDEARLAMRNFSDSFLETYLANVGERALTRVGAYQLEREGAQLFRKIDGDFFTILGLPLVPLLEFLRASGFLAD